MGVYLCTVEEKNWEAIVLKFGPIEMVYRFQPALVLGNCCGGSKKKQNIVIRVTASRNPLKRSSLIRKIRTKPPEGGFKKIDGPYIHAQRCLGGRDAWGDKV